jgi:glutathione synthase/RimK-type ligase-like ATP-grasp enzyme
MLSLTGYAWLVRPLPRIDGVPVLLATCADLPDGDEDAAVLLAALDDAGVPARWAVWDDPAVDWSAGLTVLRSTWDYTHDRARFLDWVRGLPRVANEPALVEWSTDKTYLVDLAAAGVPTVPTELAFPGEPLPAFASEAIVKPSVGAGSRGVGRFTPDRYGEAQEHAEQLHAAGRTVLVQPYLHGVDATGEAALVYFDGAFSHAITKGAMIPADTTHPVDGGSLYVEENISARVASAAEKAVADAALAFVTERFGGVPLYARVDLLPGPAGPVLVELELVEPSLFLQYDPDGAVAARFAAPMRECA